MKEGIDFIILKLVSLINLNSSQKKLIELVLSTQLYSASAFAKIASEKGVLKEATFWYNLRELQKKGIVMFGNGQDVSLTEIGKIVGETFIEKRR